MHRRKRLDDIIGQALNNAGIASPQSETSVQPFLESTSNKIVSCDTAKSTHYDTDIKRIKARKKLVFEDFQENVRKPPTSVPKPDKDVTTTENIQGSHESSKNLKNTIIYAPSQWYTVFKTARNNPFPYEVERLTYEDFNRWDAVSDKYFKGNLTGKISKLRIVTFKKNKPSYITVKYSMNKSVKSTNIEVQSKTRVPLMPCYRSRLPIAKDKYDDLVKLCNEHVIPIQFLSEFKEIPKEATKKATLPDTDIDDVDAN